VLKSGKTSKNQSRGRYRKTNSRNQAKGREGGKWAAGENKCETEKTQ
jgi:hypothetical protein